MDLKIMWHYYSNNLINAHSISLCLLQISGKAYFIRASNMNTLNLSLILLRSLNSRRKLLFHVTKFHLPAVIWLFIQAEYPQRFHHLTLNTRYRGDVQREPLFPSQAKEGPLRARAHTLQCVCINRYYAREHRENIKGGTIQFENEANFRGRVAFCRKCCCGTFVVCRKEKQNNALRLVFNNQQIFFA